MPKNVRNVNGEVMGQVDTLLEFRAGDIIRKRKHAHNHRYYFITHIGENNGNVAYHTWEYQNELFENHQSSTWKKADYFEKRVETAGEEEEWIDYSMGDFDVIGHVTEQAPYIDVDRHKYYTPSFERLSELFTEGFSSIRPAQLFYETAGTKRAVIVRQTGQGERGLANDMLRLAYLNEGQNFVEHKKNIMQAIESGLWVPIKETEARVKGAKETEL